MTEYVICFDFPDAVCAWFARYIGPAAGFTARLSDAERFSSEEEAARLLRTEYSEKAREAGAVVELAQ